MLNPQGFAGDPFSVCFFGKDLNLFIIINQVVTAIEKEKYCVYLFQYKKAVGSDRSSKQNSSTNLNKIN